MVARLMADTFAILLDGIWGTTEVLRAAERLNRALQQPFQIQGREVFVAASMGAAIQSPTVNQPSAIIRAADTALYHAKSAAPVDENVVLFEPGMEQQAASRLEIETDLRRALERHEFELHYQPVVDLQTGRVSGVEALLRWNHPRRGLISPAEFIPLAERTGLIVSIGRWVLEEACGRLQQWQQLAPVNGPLTVSVNLSARQLYDSDLIQDVQGVIEQTRIRPEDLQLEITESVMMSDAQQALETVRLLRAVGVKVAIDDFGTGYSSLAYLRQFPVHTLKIDRSFIMRLPDSTSDLSITKTIVALAQNLKLDITCEGIETGEQLELMREMGCHRAQGYFMAKPLPANKVEDLLASRPDW